MSRMDDAPKRANKSAAVKPGQIPANRLGVYNKHGHLVGHVGPGATSSTASRFSMRRGMVLGKKDGRTAWVCGR